VGDVSAFELLNYRRYARRQMMEDHEDTAENEIAAVDDKMR